MTYMIQWSIIFAGKILPDGQMLITFDGFTSEYEYWVSPDCVDIHPIGWTEQYAKNKDTVIKYNSDGTEGDYASAVYNPGGKIMGFI